MAYNVIKGNVEFSGPTQGTIEDMVDDHSDQIIGGTKTFSQMVTASSGLSASIFYGDGSNLDGITSGPIDTYDNSGNNRILTSVNSTTVQGETNLTFDGSSLTVNGDITASVNISASAFQGDGNSLTNIGPSSLNLGAGLQDLAGNLELNLDTASGLQIAAGGLKVYLSTLSNADPLADGDLFIADQSGNKKATALQLYNYVDGKLSIPIVAGANTQIQFNDAGDLGASTNLAFNSATNIFSTVTASFTGDVEIGGNLEISKELTVTGSTRTATRFHSVSVQTASYSATSGDEIILMNSSLATTASLPPISSTLVGLTLTVKRTGTGEVQVSGSNGIDTQPTINLTPQGAFVKIIAADFGGSSYGWAIIAKSGSF